ncbi:hypothetical protein EDB80DRAFT_703323 [Ilyonectria destructans]|nr:hypothetical protein EDB80DRAFT_703323 [Ilyonectria destructans]
MRVEFWRLCGQILLFCVTACSEWDLSARLSRIKKRHEFVWLLSAFGWARLECQWKITGKSWRDNSNALGPELMGNAR